MLFAKVSKTQECKPAESKIAHPLATAILVLPARLAHVALAIGGLAVVIAPVLWRALQEREAKRRELCVCALNRQPISYAWNFRNSQSFRICRLQVRRTVAGTAKRSLG